MKELTITQQADEITAVQLSNRTECGDYITYTALSRDGVTTYTVRMRDGKALACTCPARVNVKCRHMKAAEFEEKWTKPTTTGELVAREQEQDAVAEQVAPLVLGEMAQDLSAHIDDELTVQPAPAEQRVATGRYHAGMFNQRGASVYVSDEEMNALKKRVEARRQSREEHERRMSAPLNGNQGFSLLA